MAGITVAKAGAFGAGGAGIIGATGYGAYTLIQPKTIEDKLKSEGLILLDTEGTTDDQTWASHISSYPGTGTSKNKLSGLESLTGTDDEKKTNLKNKCKDELAKGLEKDTDGSILKAARDWCTKGKSSSVVVS